MSGGEQMWSRTAAYEARICELEAASAASARSLGLAEMLIRDLDAELEGLGAERDSVRATLDASKRSLDEAVELLLSAPIGGSDAEVIKFVDGRREFLKRIGGKP